MCRRWPSTTVGDLHVQEFQCPVVDVEPIFLLQDGVSQARAMLQQGVSLSRELMYQLLQKSIDHENLDTARSIHLFMASSPQVRAGVLDDRLIQLFACCSSLFEASLVFCMVAKPTRHTWHAVLSAHTSFGFNQEALSYFGQMQSVGIKPSQVTLLCILKACGIVSALISTFLTNFAILDSKFDADLTVGNSLIDTYNKCGSISDASALFETLESRDVISWNTLLSGYALSEQYVLALECFCKMQDCGIVANGITFSCILSACGALEALLQARLIHGHLLESGVQLDTVVQNTLIDTYIRCQTLEDAHEVFDNLSNRDIISWSSIIAGCMQHGCSSLALDLFAMMQQGGLKPDKIVLVSVLNSCIGLDSLRPGMIMHDELIRWKFDCDDLAGNSLLEMYSDYACLDEAFKVFNDLPSRNLVSWNILIGGHVQQEQPVVALMLFAQMQQEQVEYDEVTCQWILKACGIVCATEEGRWIHDNVMKAGFNLNVFVESSLICMYMKMGDLEGAKRVLNMSFNPTLPILNAMTSVCESHVDYDDASDIRTMLNILHPSSGTLDKETLSCILKRCAVRKAVGEGMQVHDQMIRFGVIFDVVLANTLISMYIEFGDLLAAQKTFDTSHFVDVVSWNILIGGYSQCGLDFFAIELFGRLQQFSVEPNGVTFLLALQACTNLGVLMQGRVIHDLTIRSHLDDLMTSTALVDMYAKCGALYCAEKVLLGMHKRSVVSWGALISGFGFHGILHSCQQCLEAMQREGLAPDERIFQSILAACSHSGQVKEGSNFFKLMQRVHGLRPSIEHCNCMVDILCRTGCLSEAKEFLGALPVVPDICGWMSLFTACKRHGNKDLATFCFDRGLDLDPDMAGAYLTMLNVVPDSRTWADLQ